MRTVSVENRVESETQNVRLGFCVEDNDENYDSFTYLEDMTDTDKVRVAERYSISPDFLDVMNGHFESLRDAIHNDLAQIWAKLHQ